MSEFEVIYEIEIESVGQDDLDVTTSENGSNLEQSSRLDEDVSDAEQKIRLGEDWKTEIYHTLQKIKTPNAFAFSAVSSSFPNPGLHLPQHGFVGLPLSAHDAQKIISVATPSPFGRGEETLIDESIRKCWELQPNQFCIKNSSWNNALKEMMESVSIGLGLSFDEGKFSAQLNKLLLYEPGAFFKAHRDSEKGPGMFGTLVVCLPSPHEGGKLVLTHGHKKYEFETAKSSSFDVSYAAWFADILHEVHPVTAGYRLMLTYNLIRETDFFLPPYHVVHELAQQLSILFQQYDLQLKEGDRKLPPFLLHKLKHKYTQANLKQKLLKPQDLAQVQTLKQVTADLGYDIYLATMELTVEKDDNYDDDDFTNKSQSLNNIVELDGNLVLSSLHFPDAALIDPTPLDDGKADEEKHEETGNEGCRGTYWYRNATVVLVPPSKQLDFVFQFGSHGKVIEPVFSKLMKKFTEDPIQVPKLEQLCELALKQEPRYGDYTNTVPPFFQQATATALELGRFDFFEIACRKTKDNVMLMLDIPRKLGNLAAINNLATMRDQLVRGLSIAPSIFEKIKFLESVKIGFEEVLQKPDSVERANFKQWSEEALLSAISQVFQITKADGMSLGLLHRCVDWSLFHEKIKSVVLNAALVVKITFVNEFMSSLQQNLSKEQRSFIESIVRNIWDEFDITLLHTRQRLVTPRTSQIWPWQNRTSEVKTERLEEYELQSFVENTIFILSSEYLEATVIPAILTPIPDASKDYAKELINSIISVIIKNKQNQDVNWTQLESNTLPILLRAKTVVKIVFVNEFMSALQQELIKKQPSFIKLLIHNIWSEFDIVSLQGRSPTPSVPQYSFQPDRSGFSFRKRSVTGRESQYFLQRDRNVVQPNRLEEDELQFFVDNTIIILSPEYLETTVIPAMLTPIPTVSKDYASKLFASVRGMILKNERYQTMSWSQLKAKTFSSLLKTVTVVKILFVNELIALPELSEELLSFIEPIIKNVWNEFDFDSKQEESIITNMPHNLSQSGESNSSRKNILEESDLRRFMENTMILSSPEYIESDVIPAMLRAIPNVSKECSKDLFIPIVRMILKNELAGFQLPMNEAAVPPVSHKCLVQALLKKFLIENVGSEPQPPKNYALPPGRCNCSDCTVVNRFLQDPLRQRLDFPVAERRRSHLYEIFTRQGRDYSWGIAREEDYEVQTVRSGSPYVWQITKHLGGHQTRKDEWSKRTETARKTLLVLKLEESVNGKLEAYLEPFYNSIMKADVEALPNLTSLVTLPRSSEANQLVLPPLNNLTNQLGLKREASQIEPPEDESGEQGKAEIIPIVN
ncbi:unnamed protein product [Bemisia tabaci]|uniref:Prolyl 4-hydroxylase alpha subunit Fe(2+) 2OG dioxygenase domain-containing protein n=1 Tax=Bemisia tabaci TaxID=7038 RepID=A0A9P0F3I9_BEMTA|nr:unnamed protein product [Bemisia tabaci]